MRNISLAAAAVLAAVGCGGAGGFDGPTVDQFEGRLVQGGKPVEFPEGPVQMKVFHEKGRSFGIPIQRDGTFKIGWMPIGKYSVTLHRTKTEGGKKGIPSAYTVPDGLSIVNGQTQYTIELGEGWVP